MMASVIYEFDFKLFDVYDMLKKRCPLTLCSHSKRMIRILSMFHNFLTGSMTTHDLSVMPGCFCVGEMNR